MKDQEFLGHLIKRVDNALGVDDVMRKIPEQVLPGSHGSMPEADVDRLVRKATGHSFQTSPPAELVHAHKRRRNRRRIIIISSSVLLVAAAVQWRWSGMDPTGTLTYERSFEVLFDHSYAFHSRRSAQVRIYKVVELAIRALQKARQDPSLAPTSIEALTVIPALLERPVPADLQRALRSPSLEELTDQLNTGAATYDTVGEVLERIRAGIYALHLAKAEDEGLRRYSEVILGQQLPKAARLDGGR